MVYLLHQGTRKKPTISDGSVSAEAKGNGIEDAGLFEENYLCSIKCQEVSDTFRRQALNPQQRNCFMLEKALEGGVQNVPVFLAR